LEKEKGFPYPPKKKSIGPVYICPVIINKPHGSCKKLPGGYVLQRQWHLSPILPTGNLITTLPDGENNR
jgi:hypothetical protein